MPWIPDPDPLDLLQFAVSEEGENLWEATHPDYPGVVVFCGAWNGKPPQEAPVEVRRTVLEEIRKIFG